MAGEHTHAHEDRPPSHDNRKHASDRRTQSESSEDQSRRKVKYFDLLHLHNDFCKQSVQ